VLINRTDSARFAVSRVTALRKRPANARGAVLVVDDNPSDFVRAFVPMAKLLDTAHAAIVFLEALPENVGAEAVRRLPSQGDSACPETAIIEIRVVEFVVAKPIADGGGVGDSRRQGATIVEREVV